MVPALRVRMEFAPVPKMAFPATPRMFAPMLVVPMPIAPETESPPEKVEVPRPPTFRRLESERAVEEAKGTARMLVAAVKVKSVSLVKPDAPSESWIAPAPPEAEPPPDGHPLQAPRSSRLPLTERLPL